MSATTDRILSIEKGFWTKADQPSYFADNIADAGITVLEPVGFIDKPKSVEMAADAPWTDVEMLDVQVREVTPDCVILAYHGRAKRASDGKPYAGSIASTYVRNDGAWQLALTAHQPWAPDQSSKN
jgi:hypothetical protein